MKTLQFKTNIKCDGCIAKVTPVLDGEKSIDKWEVDLKDPEKILTVSGIDVSEDKVKSILQAVGYKADRK
jgi:copper chaperone